MSKVVSHYQLQEELGKGGMGRVHKAYDETLDRTVVLKLLSPELVAEADSRKRFLREARLASALDHPNICTIYEIAEVDKQYFIAMQYIPGKTLKKIIGGRPLRLERLLSIALQIGDALSAAHAKGIVHRDIKSSNIIITPRGQAKVLDFGLAKLLGEKGSRGEQFAEELTRHGAPLGTPSYMSPEQARGERTDHRSDIYSFGVVLYEMATGRLPFRGQSSVDIMHALLNSEYEPAKALNDKLPADLSTIIDNALAREPGDRYQSVQQMLEDVQRLSVAIRFGAGGVPDGITTPFVIPRRHASRASFTQFVSRLFSRLATKEQRRRAAQDEGRSESSSDAPVPAAPQVLAVLPFRDLTGDSTPDFSSATLSEHLITELAHVPSLSVLPSSAVSRFATENADPSRLGSELGADSLLMGNFLRSGDRLRVTAQLVDATSGQIVWSDKIDGDAGNALAVQDRITTHIVSGLAGGQSALDPAQLLKDDNEEIRLDAVRTFKFSHDPRALSALVEALRDASPKVKAEAVNAIVQLGQQATGPIIQLLNDAIDERDNLTARFAAKALGLIGDRTISPVLIELLRSDDKFVACESALALGGLKETKAVPELIAMLSDSNGNIRFAAAEALGDICDPASVEALQKRLTDRDEGVRAKARWALSRLRSTSTSTRARV
jgi:serine/threonine protein kinase